MTDKDRLAEIKARHELATRGPWVETTSDYHPTSHGIGEPGRTYLGWAHLSDTDSYPNWTANSSFVTNAREDIPWLLDLVDKLIAERDEANRDLLKFIHDTTDGMICLPECDSFSHPEGCPVTDPRAAFRKLRESIAELKRCIEGRDEYHRRYCTFARVAGGTCPPDCDKIKCPILAYPVSKSLLSE